MTLDQAQDGAGEAASKTGSAPADAYGICIARSRDKDTKGEYKTADGFKPLRKGWHLNPGATIPVKAYDFYPKVTWFDLHEKRVENIDGLYMVLSNNARDPRSAVLRDKPNVADGKTLRNVRRLSKARVRKNGKTDEPTLREAPRMWLAADIDGLECPGNIDPVNEPGAVVEHVMSRLPPCFEGVTCVWNMTGSAGILKPDSDGKPLPLRIYIRLWFWLSRPLGSDECEDLLAGCPVDMSLYNAVQCHYIATPSFSGMPDPVPQRWGLLPGHTEAVEVPVIEARSEGAAPRGDGAAPAGGPSIGYENRKKAIGDHPGGRGLHDALLSAIGAYFARYGSTANVDWLRADLETTVRAAVLDPVKHPAGVVEERLADLPRMIEDIRQNQAAGEQKRAENKADDDEEGQAPPAETAAPLPELPPFPVPTLSGEEGRAILEARIKEFFDLLERHWAARDWREARLEELLEEAADRLGSMAEAAANKERKRLHRKATNEMARTYGFGRTSERLGRMRLQIAGAAAIGKTGIIARQYRERPDLWKRHIEFYGITVKNCQALVSAINAEPRPEGMPPAQVLMGRTYSDEDTEPPCARHEVAREAVKKVKSLYRAFCKSGDLRCQHYNGCPFIQARLDKSPKLRAYPHASLAANQTPDLRPPAPDLVIVDESIVSTMVKETEVPIGKIANPEIYNAPPEEIADHVALGEQVIELLNSGSNVPRRLAESDPDHIVRRLRQAAKAADGGGTLADVLPIDSDQTVRDKLAMVEGTPGWRVAALLRQLARDIKNLRADSIGVEFIPPDNKGEAGKIKVHGLYELSFPASTPLLLVDADAIREVNDHIFAPSSAPLEWLEIRCKRIAEFIQCHDNECSESTLLPKLIKGSPDSEAQVRRAAEKLQEIAAFAGRLAVDGEKVFVATCKPVRAAITGEDSEANLPVSYSDPRGFDISHIGKILGRNEWAKHTVGIQVGREQPPPNAAERIARGIYANSDPSLVEKLALSGHYVRMHRRRWPRSELFVEMWGHAEPRVQAILELRRERASVQNIDRLRLLFPDERQVTWFILCSLPLPGIVPDKLDRFDNIMAGGGPIDRAWQEGGFFTPNAYAMNKDRPDLWKSEKAAKRYVERQKAGSHVHGFLGGNDDGPQPIESEGEGRKPLTANNIILFAKRGFHPPGALEGWFRRRAPKVKWSRFFYNPEFRGPRRPDIILAQFYRELGVQHIDAIELKGPAAEAIEKVRANAERLGRMDSLSEFDRRIPIVGDDATNVINDYFATHPTRSVGVKRDGTLVDTFTVVTGEVTTEAGKRVQIRRVIPRPIDAPRLRPEKVPPIGDWRPPPHIHWFLCVARDGAAHFEWYDDQARTLVPAPAGCPWAEFSPPPPRRRSRGDFVLHKETDSAGNVVETWYNRKTGEKVPAPDDGRGEGDG